MYQYVPNIYILEDERHIKKYVFSDPDFTTDMQYILLAESTSNYT